MKRLEKHWKKFEFLYKDESLKAEKTDIKRAFYLGAEAAIKILFKHSDLRVFDDPAIKQIEAELNQFGDDLMKGRA